MGMLFLIFFSENSSAISTAGLMGDSVAGFDKSDSVS